LVVEGQEMDKPDQSAEHIIRETAEVQETQTHDEPQHMDDEKKILAGQLDVNMTAVLTKDALGG